MLADRIWRGKYFLFTPMKIKEQKVMEHPIFISNPKCGLN